LPLAQKEAEELMKTNSDVSVTVVGGGSGVGITAMIDGTTDRNGFKRIEDGRKNEIC
jgi:phosphate transport system substrate-binding protein